MKKTLNPIRRIATGFGVLFFVTSLLLPSFYTRVYLTAGSYGSLEPRMGIEALLFGWLGLIGGHNLSWIANVFWFVSIVLLCVANRRRLWGASLAAGIGFVISLHVLQHRRALLNATGIESQIESFGSGYWVWVAGFAYLLITATALWILALRSNAANP